MLKDIEQAKKFYTDILGMQVSDMEIVEQQKVKVCFIPCGDSEIELLESTTSDGPVAKFIEAKGEGLQHVALRIENIDQALAGLKAKGGRLIDEQPKYGAGDARIAFVHPTVFYWNYLRENSNYYEYC